MMFSKIKLYKIEFYLKNNYYIYKMIKKHFKKKNNNLLVSKDTDIVIEGYPRCGNTYAVVAFSLVNKNVKIAHHMHTVAQLKGGILYNKPIIVLIRKPEDAIKSLIIRNRNLSLYKAIDMYKNFYSFVFKNKDYFVISDFKDTVQNFGKIIEKVNKKFGTSFNIFEHNEYNERKVRDIILELSKTVDKESGKYGIQIPTKEKEELKKRINIPYSYLREVNILYERIIDSIFYN